MKKVIVFGNQQICLDCIKILRNNRDVQLQCVIGSELPRDKKLGYISIKNYCKDKKIHFYNAKTIDEKISKIIISYNPDLCFSVYFRNIIPKHLIELPPLGIINIHPSILPSYRGPAPTMWALIKGEKNSGVTMHYINDGIDSGDIIAQNIFKIPNNITGFSLNSLSMRMGALLFKKQLPLILNRTNKRLKQNNKNATYFGKFNPSTAKIQWYDSKFLIGRRVQALTKPYDGAYATLKGKNIVIWKIKLLNKFLTGSGGPAKVVEKFSDGSFVVRTIDGYIRIVDFDVLNVEKKDKYSFINKGDNFEI